MEVAGYTIIVRFHDVCAENATEAYLYKSRRGTLDGQ
jgi:hypothetical protein